MGGIKQPFGGSFDPDATNCCGEPVFNVAAVHALRDHCHIIVMVAAFCLLIYGELLLAELCDKFNIFGQ